MGEYRTRQERRGDRLRPFSDSCDYVFTPSAHGELAAGAVLRRGFFDTRCDVRRCPQPRNSAPIAVPTTTAATIIAPSKAMTIGHKFPGPMRNRAMVIATIAPSARKPAHLARPFGFR